MAEQYMVVNNAKNEKGEPLPVYTSWTYDLLTLEQQKQFNDWKDSYFSSLTDDQKNAYKKQPPAIYIQRWADLIGLGIDEMEESFKTDPLKVPLNYTKHLKHKLNPGENIVEEQQALHFKNRTLGYCDVMPMWQWEKEKKEKSEEPKVETSEKKEAEKDPTKMNWAELKTYAKDKGINTRGLTRDKIFKVLVEGLDKK